MASRITGRDYTTLRQEIIDLLRQKLPVDWDYQNLADPVVIFAECLARVGDQLHFTIDELRRECDMATANRASSIYSYAMREGYKMMLPKASFGTLSLNYRVNLNDEGKDVDAGKWHININKFDEIKAVPFGESLYVMNDMISATLYPPLDSEYSKKLSDYYNDDDEINKGKLSIYNAYMQDEYNKTVRINVVLGTKSEFSFTYSNINNDSTVELPDPFIDRDLVRLTYNNNDENNVEITYVDDVISSGFNSKSFTLTPKFIGGAIHLYIEFPTNYRDIFKDHTTSFKFEYIKTKDSKIESLMSYQTGRDTFNFGGALDHDGELSDRSDIIVSIGNGIKGYEEYENANVTREHYKQFVQSYSSLLTKSDYESYIKATSAAHCKVYDHGDMYVSPSVLPENTDLIPRVIYTITDNNYESRMELWYDLKERSARSDCIIMIPFGIDPYTVVVKADCYLVGTSTAEIATSVKSAIMSYYSASTGERIPKRSVIDYLAHNASDKIIRLDNIIVRDSTYGKVDSTFSNVNTLSNAKIDQLFKALSSGDITFSSDLESDITSRYYLRGNIYRDNNNNTYTYEELQQLEIESDGSDLPESLTLEYYCKYPMVFEKQSDEDSDDGLINEYNDFPKEFPKIYYVHNGSESVINEYGNLVDHQITYGELDSEDWDFEEKDIFSYNEITDNTIASVSDSQYYGWVVYNDGNVDYYIRRDELTLVSEGEDVNTYRKAEGVEKLTLYSSPIDLLHYATDQEITVEQFTGSVYCKLATASINDKYTKHHYMTPVINNVVVLIKAVNTNIR